MNVNEKAVEIGEIVGADVFAGAQHSGAGGSLLARELHSRA